MSAYTRPEDTEQLLTHLMPVLSAADALADEESAGVPTHLPPFSYAHASADLRTPPASQSALIRQRAADSEQLIGLGEVHGLTGPMRTSVQVPHRHQFTHTHAHTSPAYAAELVAARAAQLLVMPASPALGGAMAE